jgi:hypothetical protein
MERERGRGTSVQQDAKWMEQVSHSLVLAPVPPFFSPTTMRLTALLLLAALLCYGLILTTADAMLAPKRSSLLTSDHCISSTAPLLLHVTDVSFVEQHPLTFRMQWLQHIPAKLAAKLGVDAVKQEQIAVLCVPHKIRNDVLMLLKDYHEEKQQFADSDEQFPEQFIDRRMRIQPVALGYAVETLQLSSDEDDIGQAYQPCNTVELYWRRGVSSCS